MLVHEGTVGRTEVLHLVVGARPLDAGVLTADGVEIEHEPAVRRSADVQRLLPQDEPLPELRPREHDQERLVERSHAAHQCAVAT